MANKQYFGNLGLIWKVLVVLFIFQSLVISFYAYISQKELDERLIKENLAVKVASQSYFTRAIEGHIYTVQDNLYRVLNLKGINEQQLLSFFDEQWENLAIEWGATNLGVIKNNQVLLDKHYSNKPPVFNYSIYFQKATDNGVPENALNCQTECSIHFFIPIVIDSNDYVVHLITNLFNPIFQFREILDLKTLIVSQSQSIDSADITFLRQADNISLNVMRKEHNFTQFSALEKYADSNTFSELQASGGRVNIGQSHYFIEAIEMPLEVGSKSYLVTFNDISNTHQLDQQFYRTFIWLSFASLLLLFVTIVLVLWRPIARIKKLKDYLPTLAKGQNIAQFSQSNKPNLFQDEIDVLEESSNELAKRLGELNLVVSQREEELKEMALFDSLTGIANRENFTMTLQKKIAKVSQSGSHIALLFIDLDQFKHINDSLGHHFGDQVLKIVAKRLKGSVRSTDLVARLGGDEFTVLISDIYTRTNIVKVVDDILRSFNEPAHIEDHQLTIRLSIGITVINDNKASINDVIKQADIAMYSAKSDKSTHYVFFKPHMESEIAEQFSLINDFSDAICEHQFKLYFQPFYHIQQEKLFGFETLIRWNHPTRGLLSPDKFLPILKDTELMVELENWIIEEGIKRCKQLNTINDLDVICSINLTAEKYMAPQVVNELEKCMYKYNLDSKFLYIEIVEETVVHDINEAIKRSLELKALGLKVSIDDFGVGYSSLNYLRRLPANNVKIDRSFVSEIPHQKSSKKVLSALISLLISMNKTVTAEGVETQEQLAWLQDQGCHIGQGYFFSKPIPFEEAVRLTVNAGGNTATLANSR